MVYNFALKKYMILEGYGLQLKIIGGGHRKLKGGSLAVGTYFQRGK